MGRKKKKRKPYYRRDAKAEEYVSKIREYIHYQAWETAGMCAGNFQTYLNRRFELDKIVPRGTNEGDR